MTAPAPAAGPAGDTGRPPPARLAFDAHTWKEIAHLLLNLPLAVVGFVYAVTALSVSGGLTVTVLGLPLLAGSLLGARLLGRLERARARALLGLRVPEPSPLPFARSGTFVRRLWLALSDPVGWRSMLYGLIRLPWGVLTFSTVLVAFFVLWPVLSYLARGLSNVDRALARTLLAPSDELERRIAELESDRGVVVDTAAADLRRIERDLHDGAQARLVNLAMELGLAKEKLHHDPETAARMVEQAHREAKTALKELRDLARGIHPAILTDRGLDAALSHLAARCTIPVTLTVDLPTRPAPAIEGITYYTASELLQNISKHSHAHTATLDLRHTPHHLKLQIRDDGIGGADAGRGTGLAGLAERLGAVDGVFVVDSPPGGPTVVTAELPWRDRDDEHSARR
ncbi:sensor histidine kinase [Streptomyces sp. NPDC090023]|uniref:sensor histidine kinase n=1 Tax=unclassified Streptomyces TaxID=2593676 RepID=UPI0037FA8F9D